MPPYLFGGNFACVEDNLISNSEIGKGCSIHGRTAKKKLYRETSGVARGHGGAVVYVFSPVTFF